MVEIRGKRGRKVPVILTPEVKDSIDLLIKTRKAVGIPDENPYVFARPTRQSLQHMSAWDCLRNLATECDPPFDKPRQYHQHQAQKVHCNHLTSILSQGN